MSPLRHLETTPRKGIAVKGQSKKGIKASGRPTVKVNLTLGVEQQRRLFITAVMSGRTASDIVDELIAAGLKQWAMPVDLVSRAKSKDRPESTDQASESEPKAA